MKRGPHFWHCRARALPDLFSGGAKSRCQRAFSLIELLVTVVIILIVTTLYWSPNSGNRQRSLKQACAQNLQKVFISLQIYANDYSGTYPVVAAAKSSEQALNVLVPRYTSDTSVFICPSSRDGKLPSGEPIAKRKISYAYCMGRRSTDLSQLLMSDRQVDTQAKAAGQLAFSKDGKAPGNNHRRFGGNFLFCDGRVEPSPAAAAFSVQLTNGIVLLNPK